MVLQWDEVDDFAHTTYTIIWGDQVATVEDPLTSYTITGLTLDTVYIIIISPANSCGTGPEYRTIVSFYIGM